MNPVDPLPQVHHHSGMIIEGKLLEVEADRLKFETVDKVYRIDLVANTRIVQGGRLATTDCLSVDQKLRITGPSAGWSEKVITALQIDIIG